LLSRATTVINTLRRERVDGVVVMPVARYVNHAREVATTALAYRQVTVLVTPNPSTRVA
jgi:hypothetical protein